MTEPALCPVLVGREDELATLEQTLIAVALGETRAVLLGGEAGIGKTRLASELTRRALKIRFRVLFGGALYAQTGLAYAPVVEAVGRYLQELDPAQVESELGDAAAELRVLFPWLRVSARPTIDSDPGRANVRLFEAIVAVLGHAAAHAAGLLLVLEDMHLADRSTFELLDYAARRLHSSRVMLLLTFRSDEVGFEHPLTAITDAWRSRRLAEVVTLAPLAPADIARMGRLLAGGIDLSPEVQAHLRDRSEGNPYFLEELVRDAIAGATPGATARRAFRVPETVAATIARRMDRLETAHAGVLQAASVLGAWFDASAAALVAGADAPTAARALAEARDAQLVVADRAHDGGQRFRHALTRDAVYERIDAAAREHLHARAATVLGERGSPAAEVAWHLVAAERWDEAVPRLIEAGDDLLERGGAHEALELYAKALPHVVDAVARADLLLRLGRAGWQALDNRAADRHLSEGIALLDSGRRSVEAAGARVLHANVLQRLRRVRDAESACEAARRVLEKAGPSAELAQAHIRLAYLAGHALDIDARTDHARRAAEVAAACDATAERLEAQLLYGGGLAYQGEISLALRLIDEVADDALRSGHLETGASALFQGIMHRLWSLRGMECERLLERVATLPENPWRALEALFWRGHVELCLGRHGDAILSFEAVRTRAEELGVPERGMHTVVELAILYAESGALDRAREAQRAFPADDDDTPWEAAQTWEAAMRIELACRTPHAALDTARLVLDTPRLPPPLAGTLLAAAEIFLACGDVESPSRLLHHPVVARMPGGDRNPLMAQVRAGVAVARGDSAAAVASAELAAGEYAAAQYRIEEAKARVTLADAHALAGHLGEAVEQFQRAAALAASVGGEGFVAEAEAAAQRWGLRIAAPTTLPSEPPAADDALPPGETVERLVTSLFADIRGFTPMSARLAPEEMADRMSTFYRWAKREIELRGGVVEEYHGDAFMATFNLAVPALDHCQRAVDAALAIHARVAMLDLPVGIGIAVGPAVVGRMTGDRRISVLGETVNFAARLQAAAEGGETLLTGEAYRRARERLTSQGVEVSLRTVELKGIEGETPVASIRTHPRPNGYDAPATAAAEDMR